MTNNMTAGLVEAAKAEIVAHALKKIEADGLLSCISESLHISINQAAGLLDINPARARALLKDHVITFGRRQKRVPLSAINKVAAKLKHNSKEGDADGQ